MYLNKENERVVNKRRLLYFVIAMAYFIFFTGVFLCNQLTMKNVYIHCLEDLFYLVICYIKG